MESYKSPRFWLALAGLVAVSVLAGFRIFSAELAAGLLVGLLSGVGVSTPINGAALKQAGATALIAMLGIGTALALGGCAAGPDSVLASFWMSAALVVTGACTAAVVVLVRRLARWRAAARSERARGDLARAANNRLRRKLANAGVAVGMAVLLVLSPGCATTGGGGGKIDPVRAMQIACANHTAASAVAEAVCSYLPEAKRVKCLEYARKASSLGAAGLGVAGGYLGATCPID